MSFNNHGARRYIVRHDTHHQRQPSRREANEAAISILRRAGDFRYVAGVMTLHTVDARPSSKAAKPPIHGEAKVSCGRQ